MSRWPSSPGSGPQNLAGECDSHTGLHSSEQRCLLILRDANTDAGQDPHRPDCGGSTPPSCCDRVASIAAMQRFLKPQSTGQHRGDPQFHAGVAQQRQQQFRKLPGNPSHGSASLPVGPIFRSGVLEQWIIGLVERGCAVRILGGVPVNPTIHYSINAFLPYSLSSNY
jgi:hypothetical protein